MREILLSYHQIKIMQSFLMQLLKYPDLFAQSYFSYTNILFIQRQLKCNSQLKSRPGKECTFPYQKINRTAEHKSSRGTILKSRGYISV